MPLRFRGDLQAHLRGLVRRIFLAHNGCLFRWHILVGRGGRDHLAISAGELCTQSRTDCGIRPRKGSQCVEWIRRGIASYLHFAGIQAGYTFFAPNIPGYYRLTFELYYEDDV